MRDALVRQWQAITAAVATIDLEPPSRVAGWRNREVVARLCLQPTLLRKFIATAPAQHAVVTVAASLAGTHSLARLVDASAREAAEAGRVDFAKAAREAVPALRAADLSAAVVTMQGPIRLADYLVTRCVEAVVHGSDLAGPVRPDRVAQAIPPEGCSRRSPPGLPTSCGRPGSAIAIADVSAGIQAAKASGMAALGVARAGDADLLAAAGADLVVTTLDDVDTTALSERTLATRKALRRTTTASRWHRATVRGRRSRLRPRQRAQIDPFGVESKIMRAAYHNVPNGGFARACPLADSHGSLTVSPSDAAVDRPVRIGQDGGAVSAVVIDRSRTVLMQRQRGRAHQRSGTPSHAGLTFARAQVGRAERQSWPGSPAREARMQPRQGAPACAASRPAMI